MVIILFDAFFRTLISIPIGSHPSLIQNSTLFSQKGLLKTKICTIWYVILANRENTFWI